MTGPDFDHFCQLALIRSGLVLGPAKAYLVQNRLDPIARSAGLADVPALLARLRSGAAETLIDACVDAMATHESLFFRDASPFEQLARVVFPALVATRGAGRPIRVWSAACSSGQEPYSIAILAQELTSTLAGLKVEVVATDMAEAILTKARAGIFSDFEVNRGLSPERRSRWMTPRGGSWELSPQIRSMVSFRRHNLLNPLLGEAAFDVVFCRNVLIYFDQAGKTKALDQIARAMAADGHLFLGSADNVIGLNTGFEAAPNSRGLFQRTPMATCAADQARARA